MATIYFTGADDLEKALKALGDRSDEALDLLIGEMISETTDAWKEAGSRAGFDPPGKSGKGTGEMMASIGPGEIRTTASGRYTEVYPQGKNSRGIRNAEIAFYQNYGTSRVKPTYWVDKAEAAADEALPERLDGVWEDFLSEATKVKE